MTRPTYTSPGGAIHGLYADMLRQAHLLIAGASGSGKSTLLNGLLCAAIKRHPNDVRLLLIDPKRTELNEYADLPHTIRHATEPSEFAPALRDALQLIDCRYEAMQRERRRTYNGADVYIIVDEFADLMTTQKKQILPLVQRICQIGRAARVHMILATQCPLAKIVPTEVKVNFSAICGLHTATRAHSRNIIGTAGCELLPMFGQCIYQTPQGIARYAVPNTTAADIQRATDHYRRQWRGILSLTRGTQPR